MVIVDSVQHSGCECDMCFEGTKFEQRAAMLARGATGRWCEVLWICDDCAVKYDRFARDVAIELIEKNNMGTVDF